MKLGLLGFSSFFASVVASAYDEVSKYPSQVSRRIHTGLASSVVGSAAPSAAGSVAAGSEDGSAAGAVSYNCRTLAYTTRDEQCDEPEPWLLPWEPPEMGNEQGYDEDSG